MTETSLEQMLATLLDHPVADVIRHDHPSGASSAGPETAFAATMPPRGGELRIEGVRDHNSPDEVGPPVYHDPVSWDGWIRYHHESTFAGAGMSYVRGQVLTEDGRLMASFTQDAMIRAFQPNGSPASMAFESRLCGGTL